MANGIPTLPAEPLFGDLGDIPTAPPPARPVAPQGLFAPVPSIPTAPPPASVVDETQEELEQLIGEPEEDIFAVEEEEEPIVEEPPAVEPVAAVPSVVEDVVTPVEAPELATVPEPTVEEVAGRVIDTGRAQELIDNLAQSKEQKRILEQGAARDYAQAQITTDPAERSRLMSAVRRSQVAISGLDQSINDNRATLDAEQAKIAADTEKKQSELELAGARQIQSEQELATAKAAAERQKSETAIADAQASVRETREEISQIVKEGAQTKPADWVSGVARVIAESINASIDRRPPNFDRIFADMQKTIAERTNRLLKSKQEQVGITGDRITDMAARQAVADEQADLEKAEIQRSVAETVRQKQAQAASPLQRAQLGALADNLNRQAEAAEANASAKQADRLRKAREAGLKERKLEAEIDLTRARTDKEKAAAAKALAEARRRGRSGKPRSLPGPLLPANVVPFPGSDKPLVTLPDTPQGHKEAKTTKTIMFDQVSALDQVNLVISLMEDAEKNGVLKSLFGVGTSANQKLMTEIKMLATQMAAVKSGGRATTTDDEEWGKGMAPKDPKAWTNINASLSKLNALRGVIERTANNQLQKFTRLNAADRNKVIAASRRKSVSKRDVSKKKADQASQILTDPKKPEGSRIAAIGNVIANARKVAKEQKGDWLEVAAADLIASRQSTEGKVRDAVDNQLKKLRKLAADRSQSALSRMRSAARLGPDANKRQRLEFQQANQIRDRISKVLK